MYIVDSSRKYCVPVQQCGENPLLRLHSQTQKLYVVDSDTWLNNTERNALFLVHFYPNMPQYYIVLTYRGADKSLARPTSRCILFDGENISFDASLVIYSYTNSTNIPPIMIINRIYETQNLLSL